MKKIVILSVILFTTVMFAQAQRIKKLEGDPKVLAGETKLNVSFTYNNMSVGKFDKEADYIASKKADYNKKEAGKGDTWVQAWV